MFCTWKLLAKLPHGTLQSVMFTFDIFALAKYVRNCITSFVHLLAWRSPNTFWRPTAFMWMQFPLPNEQHVISLHDNDSILSCFIVLCSNQFEHWLLESTDCSFTLFDFSLENEHSMKWHKKKKFFSSTLPYIQRLYRFVLSLVGYSAVDSLSQRMHHCGEYWCILYKHVFNTVPWEICCKASPTLKGFGKTNKSIECAMHDDY